MRRNGIVFALAMTLLGGSVAHAGEDEGAAKAKPAAEAAERAVHKVSVFSYVQDWRASDPPRPVLVAFELKGKTALTGFCHNIPAVQEAVLMTMIRLTQLASNGPGTVSSEGGRLKAAIGKVVPVDAIEALSVQRGEKARDFGPAIKATQETCAEHAPEPKKKKGDDKKKKE